MADHAQTPEQVPVLARYAKAFAALAGTLTPAALIGVLAGLGVDVPSGVAVAVCSILGTLATLFAPANVEPAPEIPAAPEVPADLFDEDGDVR